MASTDMGSIECIGVVKTPYTGNGPQKFIKSFRGLKADFDKLPTDDDLATGSFAFFLDTSERAEYHAPTKKWYMVAAGGGASGGGSGGAAGGTGEDKGTLSNDRFNEIFNFAT